MPDAKTPVVPEDIYQLGWPEDPRLSPDGRWVAYVRVSVDKAKNSYRRAIWLAAADGALPPRQFTSGQGSDHSPRWSPDGRRLAFVSNREGEKDQVYVMVVDGGEARSLTCLETGARSPAWSPDGSQIACVARVSAEDREREDRGEKTAPPADKYEAEIRKVEDRRRREQSEDPRIALRLPYRTGTTFLDEKRNHIYVVPSDPDAEDKTPRRLTTGDGNWGPPGWAPDGQSLVATRQLDPQQESLFLGRCLWSVPLAGGEPALLAGPPYSYAGNGPAAGGDGPLTSPDGQWIATLRIPEEKATNRNTRLAVLPAAGGEARDLTIELDRSVMGFRWTPEGELLAAVEDRGDLGLYRVGLDGAAERVIWGRRIIQSFDTGPKGRVTFTASMPDNPGDVWMADTDGDEPVRPLTQLQAKYLAGRTVVIPEEIWYTAPDGLDIQGWIVYPTGFDPAGQYPLAVFIHGGPHTMWGPSFVSLWADWQSAVGRGYVVFFCNPRGSEGYGQAFQEALYDGWGEADYQDILSGIDTVVARGGIDSNRICVTGGSYGGFMTAWLISHDQRFRAAVAQRGVYHLMSFYGTSDAYELIENEFEGPPWERVEKLWRHSPLAYAHQIQTPLLILHAELDYRVPISDAEQLFALLRRLGRTVELVRYPREGHELTRSGEPKHRIDHLTRILDWFDKYAT
ncbi:MAG: S9 family peptidase [Anaerolineae bacterium]|nr:S9 family peptidase [Anaerolineae bacterium]